MKIILLTSLMVLCVTAISQSKISIIPTPVKMEMKKGVFMLTPQTFISAPYPETQHEAKMLNVYLENLYGFTLPVKPVKSGKAINLILDKKLKKDAYSLTVNNHSIIIKGGDSSGLFHGIQTLLQLLPPNQPIEIKNFSIEIPAVSIEDHPRFAYRGMHLDVSRHFFDVDYIKKYIDFLAMQKFNTFHWHLTDDQGWRIEIKRYPKLTSVGAWRNGTIIGRYPGTGNDSLHYGGFYTQDEIKDVVKYAADRYINVIPEIEMPGHASAAIAAYPELSCFPEEPTIVPPRTDWAGPQDKKEVQQTWGIFPDVFCPGEYTFNFLENVLDEVMELFPSKYIHIGGDECPKENWKRCASCQELINEKGLKDENGLQSFFITTIEQYLNSKGRMIIGWDEILEGGLAPNATVMSWRGEAGGVEAADMHHDVIMTPETYCYLDHSQTTHEDSITIGGFTPLDKVYNYEPVPNELDSSKAKFVLGAQGNVWTEYMHYPSKIEYMIFPRMSALSEVLWTPVSNRSWERFEASLPEIYERYKLWRAGYFMNSGVSD